MGWKARRYGLGAAGRGCPECQTGSRRRRAAATERRPATICTIFPRADNLHVHQTFQHGFLKQFLAAAIFAYTYKHSWTGLRRPSAASACLLRLCPRFNDSLARPPRGALSRAERGEGQHCQAPRRLTPLSTALHHQPLYMMASAEAASRPHGKHKHHGTLLPIIAALPPGPLVDANTTRTC